MIFHEDTEKQLELIRANPAQALLFCGQRGVGLSASTEFVSKGHINLMVEPEAKLASPVISVDRVRQIYDETKTKQTGKLFLTISDAESMTIPAQNAFLKLLEEPNKNIHFILTTSQPQMLLPTVLSRLQKITIRPISTQQSLDLLESLGVDDARKRTQLMFLAEGLPERLQLLAHNDLMFDQSVEQMKSARTLLQADLYQKLILINSLKNDRPRSIELIEAATLITTRSLKKDPQPSQIAELEKLTDAFERLKRNQNIRLTLARYVL